MAPPSSTALRLILLVNPRSGQGRGAGAVGAIADRLTGLGHSVRRVEPPSAEQVAPGLAAAIEEGADRVLVAGGDGLFHRALPALLAPTPTGPSAPVGLLPVGTGNDFARALGHARRIEQVIERALGPTRWLDVLQTPGGPVASVVTAGFSGRVNLTANGMTLPVGSMKYTLATLKESTRLRPVPLRMQLDDGRIIDQDVSFVAIANTRYFGGGMAICPDADPADGLLDVTVVDPLSAPRLLLFLPLVYSGRHVRHPAVTTYRARSVSVTCGDSFWGDGEALGFAAGRIGIAPRSIAVAGGGSVSGPEPGPKVAE